MLFISPNLESLLVHLNKLSENTLPDWGNMSAQRMVEHLSESLNMSMGMGEHKLLISEDKLPSMKAFLFSDKPMAKNIQVYFAPEKFSLRNESLELAIDEFCEIWIDFENYYENNKDRTALHPYYGNLNYEEWLRLHSKHFTHHFHQFNLL